MGMKWFRAQYGVPAKRGGRVEFTPHYAPQKLGTITGSRSGHLLIRMDGEKRARPYHPTWMLRYLDETPQSEGR